MILKGGGELSDEILKEYFNMKFFENVEEEYFTPKVKTKLSKI